MVASSDGSGVLAAAGRRTSTEGYFFYSGKKKFSFEMAIFSKLVMVKTGHNQCLMVKLNPAFDINGSGVLAAAGRRTSTERYFSYSGKFAMEIFSKLAIVLSICTRILKHRV